MPGNDQEMAMVAQNQDQKNQPKKGLRTGPKEHTRVLSAQLAEPPESSILKWNFDNDMHAPFLIPPRGVSDHSTYSTITSYS